MGDTGDIGAIGEQSAVGAVLPLAGRVDGAPPPPPRRLHVGVTGHRFGHAGFNAAADRISLVLAGLFDAIDAALATAPVSDDAGRIAPVRLYSLLADGTDIIAAERALDRGYELVAPLPFGRRLNKTINARPRTIDDARALLAGDVAADPETRDHADALRRISDRARIFALADHDAALSAQLLASFDCPAGSAAAQVFAADVSRRVALAGRILIEQSDLIIAVWDGGTTAPVGGTGHTIAAALDAGAPVIWIDTDRPEEWVILDAPEMLVTRAGARSPDRLAGRDAALAALVRAQVVPGGRSGHPGLATLARERWRPHSSRWTHAYRRVETLFGGASGGSRLRGLTQHYPSPTDPAILAADPLVTAVAGLPGGEPELAGRIATEVTRRFAWTDAVASHLSDAYRGGMIVNFILSSLAIVAGIAYLPLVGAEQKWAFALFELVLLSGIVAITRVGRRRRLHGRWFELRRMAEYLRGGAVLLALGAARAPGRWPRGAETAWPEFAARQALRAVGLPRLDITPAYLRAVLTDLVDAPVTAQRDYHRAKAQRLNRVHHNLDRLSERLFQLAIVSVAIYLSLVAGGAAGLFDAGRVTDLAKPFTVLGVLFPTFGAGIAGIRYFGDFERFAAISEVAAGKLDALHERIQRLLTARDDALDYGSVAELARAADDIVFAEIEGWQAVFSSKQFAVPV